MQLEKYKADIHEKISNLKDPARKFNSITRIQHPIRLQLSSKSKQIPTNLKIKNLSNNALIYKSKGLINVRSTSQDESFSYQNHGNLNYNNIDLKAKTFVEPLYKPEKKQIDTKNLTFKINNHRKHLNYKMFDLDRSSNYIESDTTTTLDNIPRSHYKPKETPEISQNTFFIKDFQQRGKSSMQKQRSNDKYSTKEECLKTSAKTILQTKTLAANVFASSKSFSISASLARFYSNNLPVDYSEETTKVPVSYSSTVRPTYDEYSASFQKNLFSRKMKSGGLKKPLERAQSKKTIGRFDEIYDDQEKALGERTVQSLHQNFIEKEKNTNHRRDLTDSSNLSKYMNLPANYQEVLLKTKETTKNATERSKTFYSSDLIFDNFASLNLKSLNNDKLSSGYKASRTGLRSGVKKPLNTKILEELDEINFEQKLQRDKKDMLGSTSQRSERYKTPFRSKFKSAFKMSFHHKSYNLDDLMANKGEQTNLFNIPVFLVPQQKDFNEYYFNKYYVDTSQMEDFDDAAEKKVKKKKVSKWAKVRAFVKMNMIARIFKSLLKDTKPKDILKSGVIEQIGITDDLDEADIDQLEKAIKIVQNSTLDIQAKIQIVEALNSKKRANILKRGSMSSLPANESPIRSFSNRLKSRQITLQYIPETYDIIKSPLKTGKVSKKRRKDKISKFQQGRINEVAKNNELARSSILKQEMVVELSDEDDNNYDPTAPGFKKLRKTTTMAVTNTKDNFSMAPKFIQNREGKEEYSSYWMDCIQNVYCEEYYWTVDDVGYYSSQYCQGGDNRTVKSYKHGGEYKKFEFDEDFYDREDRFKELYKIWNHLDLDLDNDNRQCKIHHDIEELIRLNEEDPDWVYDIPEYYPVHEQGI